MENSYKEKNSNLKSYPKTLSHPPHSKEISIRQHIGYRRILLDVMYQGILECVGKRTTAFFGKKEKKHGAGLSIGSKTKKKQKQYYRRPELKRKKKGVDEPLLNSPRHAIPLLTVILYDSSPSSKSLLACCILHYTYYYMEREFFQGSLLPEKSARRNDLGIHIVVQLTRVVCTTYI